MVVEAALWQPDGAAEEGCSITGGGREASLGTVPPSSLSHHMPSSCSATGGALCRHLCTLFKCPARVCVWHQRMWQGLHCRLATAAMWCRYRYSPAPCRTVQLQPRPTRLPPGDAARHLLVRRAAAQLAPPELTPTCHPARFSSQQGQIVKKWVREVLAFGYPAAVSKT